MSTRILTLASGTGTNFQAVVQAIQEIQLQRCRVVQLITDRPGTGAAHFARENDIPVADLN